MWWQSLSSFRQVLFCVAGSATLITIIQTILLFIGFDNDGADDIEIGAEYGGGDSIIDIAGLKLFTFRGIVAGICVGGWMGYAVSGSELPIWATIVISVVTMAVTMVLYAWALKASMKLQSAGNIDIVNAKGKTATVYLAIPPQRKGKGKVNLTLQERYVEFDAVTDDEEKIPTGAEVSVISNVDDTTVMVSANRK